MRDTSEYLLDELRKSHDSSYTIQEIFSQKYDIMIRYLWLRIYLNFVYSIDIIKPQNE